MLSLGPEFEIWHTAVHNGFSSWLGHWPYNLWMIISFEFLMILLQTSQLNQEEGANTWSWFKPPWSVGAAGQIKREVTVLGDLVGDSFPQTTVRQDSPWWNRNKKILGEITGLTLWRVTGLIFSIIRSLWVPANSLIQVSVWCKVLVIFCPAWTHT